jgi:general secretion pathway protein J
VRRRQRGFTLIEVMVATAVLCLMMVIAWGSVVQTMNANKHFGAVEDRYREARTALAKMASDLAMAYISANEQTGAQEPRTFFIGETSGDASTLRFSSFAHLRLYADANQSDQAVIAYFAASDPVNRSQMDIMRRESRRMSWQGEKWDTLPGETDILFSAVTKLKLTFFDVRANEWKDAWTSQGEGTAARLPTRVRIALSFADENGKEITLTTQAAIPLQEQLLFLAH